MWSNMFGEVKLVEDDYTVVRERCKNVRQKIHIPDKAENLCQESCVALHLYKMSRLFLKFSPEMSQSA